MYIIYIYIYCICVCIYIIHIQLTHDIFRWVELRATAQSSSRRPSARWPLLALFISRFRSLPFKGFAHLRMFFLKKGKTRPCVLPIPGLLWETYKKKNEQSRESWVHVYFSFGCFFSLNRLNAFKFCEQTPIDRTWNDNTDVWGVEVFSRRLFRQELIIPGQHLRNKLYPFRTNTSATVFIT